MINFQRASTATYINKQGVLTVAQANEPRFEEGGILIEGTSTNVYTPDSMLQNRTDGLWNASPTTVRLGDVDFTITKLTNPNSSSLGSCYGWTSTMESFTGGTYAVTAMYKKHSKLVGIVDNSKNQRGLAPNIEFVNGLPSKGVKGCTLLGYSMHGEYVIFTYTVTNPTRTPTIFTMNFSSDTVINGVEFGIVQLEKLPFATSYIPTNGSAVTRAVDKLSVDFGAKRNSKTVYFKYNTQSAANTNTFYDNTSWSSGEECYTSQQGTGWGTTTRNSSAPAGEHSIVITVDETYIDSVSVKKSPLDNMTASSISLGNNRGFGVKSQVHLKNFKIWDTTLTPEQISTL